MAAEYLRRRPRYIFGNSRCTSLAVTFSGTHAFAPACRVESRPAPRGGGQQVCSASGLSSAESLWCRAGDNGRSRPSGLELTGLLRATAKPKDVEGISVGEPFAPGSPESRATEA